MFPRKRLWIDEVEYGQADAHHEQEPGPRRGPRDRGRHRREPRRASRARSRCSCTVRSWPAALAHLGAYVRFEGSLDMRVRVLAAMTVARELDAVYVWGAQTGGARRLGVPEATITAIRENHSRGIPPEDAQIVDFTRAAAAPAPRRRRDRQGAARAVRRRRVHPAHRRHRLLQHAVHDGERLRARGRPGRRGARRSERIGHGDRRRADPHLDRRQAREPASTARSPPSRQDELLKEMDAAGVDAAVIHPPTSWDPERQRARRRGRAPASQSVRDPRQFPARQPGEPRADRRLEGAAGDARAALHLPAAAPEARGRPTAPSTGCGRPPSAPGCRSR